MSSEIKFDGSVDPVTWFYAMSFVGTPYRWAGDDPLKGLDCSGFVIELLQSSGILPNSFDTTSQGLHDHFSQSKNGIVAISPSFGCLSFYGASKKQITHVGFFIDNFRIINAGGGNSQTTTLEKAAEQNAFVKIRPFNYRKDLVAILQPNHPAFL